jgi:hypothetical protein
MGEDFLCGNLMDNSRNEGPNVQQNNLASIGLASIGLVITRMAWIMAALSNFLSRTESYGGGGVDLPGVIQSKLNGRFGGPPITGGAGAGPQSPPLVAV